MARAAKFIPSFLFILLLAVFAVDAQSPTPVSVAGAYPANYQEILNAWLNNALVDPKSVQVKWLGEPRSGSLTIKGQKITGYLVDFSVNARNVFGAYTGAQKHTALIRDGQVVTATGFVAR
jgi:hypothetical protein